MKRYLVRSYCGCRLHGFFLDAETALLRGGPRLDRLEIECRLCQTTLPADDDARLLHMRSTHRKEWRKLTRL